MQKPRLTDRTAEALQLAIYNLRMDRDMKLPGAHNDGLKRAIEYLEDLLRWKRQRETARFKPAASQSADTLSKRQG